MPDATKTELVTYTAEEAAFLAALKATGATATERDGKLVVNGGYVDLRSLTELPDSVQFNNGGGVNLTRLAELPESVQFNNNGNVYLLSLTELPDSVQFNNGGYVDLRSLTELPDSVQFNNGGGVYLPSLTELPDNVQFNNGGGVNLTRLTELPDNVQFNNGGTVYLRSLTDERQHYRGAEIRLRTVDGFTLLIERERERGDTIILHCRYFGGGDLDKLGPCFVATQGEYAAHGATVREAVEDLRFKIAGEDFDRDELIATVLARGKLLRHEFRLLTGACSEGLRHGLAELGEPEDLEEMDLAKALRLVRGRYGERELYAAFAGAVQ